MKRSNVYGLMTGLLTLALLPTNAQQILSLQQAQDYAVANAFSVKTARADEEAAKLNTEQLIGIGMPQVNGSIQYQNYIDLPTSLVPAEFFGGDAGDFARLQFGTPHNMTVGISASQLLFDGSWLVGLEASKEYASLQRKQVQKSEQDVRSEVASAYHLALIAVKNAELLQASRDNINQLLHDTKGLLDAGFAEEQDVQQLQLSVNDFDNRIAYATKQTKITMDLLKFRIGMPLNTEVTLSDSADILLAAADMDISSIAFQPEANMDVQLVQGGLGMQQLSVKNERAKKLPQVGAFYNLQTGAQRNEFSFFDASEPWFPVQLWGIQVSVPIFSGFSKTKSIEKAQVEVQRMTDMLAMTREAVQLEYTTALNEFEFARSNYQSSEANLKLAEDILKKTNIKFKEGLASSFEVSQHSSQVLAAQGNYVQAMLGLLNAKTRLQKALNQ